MTVISAQPSQGSCFQLEQWVCELGAIAGGGQAAVAVEAESPGGIPVVNQAVIGSAGPASPEATASDSRTAAVTVTPPKAQVGAANSKGEAVPHHHNPAACGSSVVATASRC
jgi:hypothetical protein